MNKIFHYGIILFIIVGLIFNKQEAMLKALLQTPFDVFELCKTLILSICLWNGLLKIIQASNMMNHLNFLFKPLLRWIYGRCIQDEQILSLIHIFMESINMVQTVCQLKLDLFQKISS